MDKAEQPTTQADRRLDELKPRDIDGHLSDAIQDCLRQRFGLVLSTSETTIMAQGAIAALNTRTTSLAAQDGLDDHFPSGLRQRSHQIATAGDVVDGPVCVDCHCGASFSATDEGEARQLWASHAMAAMERPKTAAQDGLVAEIERQEGLVKTYRGAQLRAEEKLCREQANAQGWKRRAEILESKLAALTAIKEQRHG